MEQKVLSCDSDEYYTTRDPKRIVEYVMDVDHFRNHNNKSFGRGILNVYRHTALHEPKQSLSISIEDISVAIDKVLPIVCERLNIDMSIVASDEKIILSNETLKISKVWGKFIRFECSSPDILEILTACALSVICPDEILLDVVVQLSDDKIQSIKESTQKVLNKTLSEKSYFWGNLQTLVHKSCIEECLVLFVRDYPGRNLHSHRVIRPICDKLNIPKPVFGKLYLNGIVNHPEIKVSLQSDGVQISCSTESMFALAVEVAITVYETTVKHQ